MTYDFTNNSDEEVIQFAHYHHKCRLSIPEGVRDWNSKAAQDHLFARGDAIQELQKRGYEVTGLRDWEEFTITKREA